MIFNRKLNRFLAKFLQNFQKIGENFQNFSKKLEI